jgi:hypothetical protein
MKRSRVIASAAAAAVVVVAVYEGRLALSRDRTSAELSAGEEGQADREGAKRMGQGAVAANDPPAPESVTVVYPITFSPEDDDAGEGR